ncbi:MAG: hypothetical protein ACRD9Y_19065 [Blastocatellia bacterium]
MSQEFVTIYFGLKFPVKEDEVKALQKKEHSYQTTARRLGLDCCWGDSSPVVEEFFVFIGKELGRLGREYDWNKEASETELVRSIETTKATLKEAGFKEKPKLLMHFQPDI